MKRDSSTKLFDQFLSRKCVSANQSAVTFHSGQGASLNDLGVAGGFIH